MFQRKNLARVGGVVLLMLLLLCLPWADRLAMAAGGGGLLVSALYYLLFAAALCLLGVARPMRSPFTYLAPALALALFYTAFLWGETMETAYPRPLGMMLLGLCLILGVWGAARERGLGRLDAQAAAVLLALMLLGCISQIAVNFWAQALGTSGKVSLPHLGGFLLRFSPCLVLLPLLRKNRWGGVALMGVGGAGLLLYWILGASPLSPAIRAAHGSPNLLMHFLYLLPQMLALHMDLLVAFLLGGLWCALPAGKAGGSAPRA